MREPIRAAAVDGDDLAEAIIGTKRENVKGVSATGEIAAAANRMPRPPVGQ